MAQELILKNKVPPKIVNRVLSEVEDDVEEIMGNVYEGKITNLTPFEHAFVHAYVGHAYRILPCMKEILPAEESEGALQKIARGLLTRPRVLRAIAYNIRLRQARNEVTFDWVANKYRTWADMDMTQFFEVRRKDDGTMAITAKTDFEDMHPEVRKCIKSMKVDDKGSLEITFIDQKAALDSLVKLLGFEQAHKIDLKVKGGLSLKFDAQDEGA